RSSGNPGDASRLPPPARRRRDQAATPESCSGSQLKPSPTRQQPLKIALGLAVPAIEAWYLHGTYPQVGEAAWRAGSESGRFPFSVRELKERVYGTERPTLAVEVERATEAARRLSGRLAGFEEFFPGGFGALARDVRSWRGSRYAEYLKTLHGGEPRSGRPESRSRKGLGQAPKPRRRKRRE
ncbi:MAG: hypothetical protein L0323_14270, partial [Planctomycetes bacterium]|nr:hypothetical protein [Planctomycetota bacterium]